MVKFSRVFFEIFVVGRQFRINNLNNKANARGCQMKDSRETGKIRDPCIEQM